MPHRVSYFVFAAAFGSFLVAVLLGFARASPVLIGTLLAASGALAAALPKHVAVIAHQLGQLLPFRRKSAPRPRIVLVWGIGVLILAAWLLFGAH
jgi:hypothetical protein